MIYGKVLSAMDTVEKMLRNGDPHDKILQMVDTLYPTAKIDLLKQDILGCTACELCNCNHTPFEGSINSDIMFVGEAPGEQEEKTGHPFVGPAGESFNRMLLKASEVFGPHWSRDHVYITNTVKCRPQNGNSNRQPDIKEIAACKQILDREIAIVNPKVIICVGAVAANTLIHPNFKITDEHGTMFGNGPKHVAIYHPSYILRKGEKTPEGKAYMFDVWNDLVKINDYLKGLED